MVGQTLGERITRGRRFTLQRSEVALVLLTLAAVVAGTVFRVVGLGSQDYWEDEMFSVGQASGTLDQLFVIGRIEVHPPTFAVLLWGWIRIGGTSPGWVRLFPALCGVVAVLVSWLGLRHSALALRVRMLIVAATACSGIGLIYAQEARVYGPLLLAAVGVTASSMVLVTRDRASWPQVVIWVGWMLAASALHLFGALLALGTGMLLSACARSVPKAWVIALAACLPQWAWLWHGGGTPGFASWTGWIKAPTPDSVWGWLTTTFGAGGLVVQDDGFRLTAPWLLAWLVLLALAAGLTRWRLRPGQDDEVARRVVGYLGALVLVSVVGWWLLSQAVHLWTLRNLIVLSPALSWFAVLGVERLAGSERARVWASRALVLGLLAGLVGTNVAIQPPYKSQTGRAMDYLAELRAQDPMARVVGNVDERWLLSSEQPVGMESFYRLVGPYSYVHEGAPIPIPAPTGWTTLYILRPRAAPLGAAWLAEQAGEGCRPLDFVQLVVVRCDR